MPQQEKKKLRSADAQIDAVLAGGTFDEPAELQAARVKKSTEIAVARQEELEATPSALFPKREAGLLTRLAEDLLTQGGGAAIGARLGRVGGAPGTLIGAGLGAAIGELGKQTALRQAGRTDAAETPQELLTGAGLAALGGPLQEFGAAAKLTQTGRAQSLLRPGSRITPTLAAAQEAGVGITKGQARGGFRQSFEDFVSKTFGGGKRFKNFGQQQAEELNRGIDEFVSTISRSRLEPEIAGEILQDAIKGARKVAGEQVGKALDDVVKQLPDLQVPQRGELADAAKTLLDELVEPTAQHPALRRVAREDIGTSIAILRDFAKATTFTPEVTSKLLDASGKPIVLKEAATEVVTIPIKNATKLRSLLFKLTDSPDISTIGEGALKRINGALHDAIGQAVKDARRPELFGAFEAASSNFRDIAGKIESRAIQQLLKEDKHALVVDILLRKGSADRVRRVLDVVGEQNFKPVARATIQKMFDEASSEGILISQSFANIRKRVGDKALGALLGDPESIARFERLSKLIDGIGLTKALTQPQAPSGGLGLLQGGLGATGIALATGNISAAAVAGGFTALLVGVPRVLAEAATRPRFLATIEKELAVAAKREGRIGIIKRLTGFVVSEIEQDVARTLLRPQALQEQPNEQ